MIRSAIEAQADLEQHFVPLAAIADGVHKTFQAECRAIAPMLEGRTKASIYRDLFIRRLREYCDQPNNGAQFFRKDQLVLVGLESRYALRVKQLASGYAVGVSPTYASEQYDANELPDYVGDLFDDAPATTLLYLAWTIPENAPTKINLFLVCNGPDREVRWVIPLGSSDDTHGVQSPLPVNDDDDGVGVRVRVGRDKKRDNG